MALIDNVSNNNSKLVYIQAQQNLLKMIKGPDFSFGDKIPAERELSVVLNVSRMTVRKAIQKLIEEGILERRGTSGTFISIPRVYRPLDQQSAHSISEIVSSKGDVAGSKLLFFEMTQANSPLAKRLNIAEGTETIVIRRLRTANNIPFCVETSYIPANLTPGLSASDIINSPSLYALLKERFSLEPGHGEGLVSVAQVTHQESELLGMKKNETALVYRSVVSDKKGNPMEYLVSVNHPKQVVFYKTIDGKSCW